MVSSKSWDAKRAHGGLSSLVSREAVSVPASNSLVMAIARSAMVGGPLHAMYVAARAKMLSDQTKL